MILRLSSLTRNAVADLCANLIDAGGDAGTISFYTEPQPPSADAKNLTRGQTLLGTISFAFPAAKKAQDGSIEFAPSEQALAIMGRRNGVTDINPLARVPWIIESDAALASGEAAWARVQDANGNVIFDCDVTGPGGGGIIEMNSTSISEGGPLRVSNLILTVPAG